MDDNPDNASIGWSVATLHAHISAILEERDRRWSESLAAQRTAVDAALAAAQRATTKAEDAAEKRFGLLNELRGAMADQAALFMPRSESDAAISRQVERIQELTNRMNRLEGRGSGLNAGWAYLVAAIGAIATVVGIILALRH
jgi:hypothetical protein